MSAGVVRVGGEFKKNFWMKVELRSVWHKMDWWLESCALFGAGYFFRKCVLAVRGADVKNEGGTPPL